MKYRIVKQCVEGKVFFILQRKSTLWEIISQWQTWIQCKEEFTSFDNAYDALVNLTDVKLNYAEVVYPVRSGKIIYKH